MSLLGTLAKVAIGVAAAKGVGHMVQKGRAGGSAGDGGLFGGAHSPGRQAPSDRGGLEDMLGSILGGGPQAGSAGAGGGGGLGGLGGLLEGLTQGGGAAAGRAGGGLDDLLGSLTKGGAGGALGGLLGSLTGGAASGGGGGGGGFGELLNQSLQTRGEPPAPPSREQEAAAGLMLRAMIQAAKSDGKLDEGEREKLLGQLGDVSPDEKRFVQDELAAPVDVEGLARQVPAGMGPQVYAMSVMGIDLDNQAEAQYLHDLATRLGIDQQSVNHIHAQLSVPALYS